MKKIILPLLLVAVMVLTGCNNRYESNLKTMGVSLNKYLTLKDIENRTQTTVETIQPLSYAEIAEADRKDSASVYLGKVFLKSRWVYLDGSTRVYNVDDTIECYFDKDFNVVNFKH